MYVSAFPYTSLYLCCALKSSFTACSSASKASTLWSNTSVLSSNPNFWYASLSSVGLVGGGKHGIVFTTSFLKQSAGSLLESDGFGVALGVNNASSALYATVSLVLCIIVPRNVHFISICSF